MLYEVIIDILRVQKLKTLVTDCLEKLYVIVEKAQEDKRKTAGLLGLAKNLMT